MKYIPLILALLPLSLLAELRLPALFSDHAVLQREKPIKVWGWAEPRERVTVELADQSETARANRDGRWEVTLDPMEAGGPYTLTVTGQDDSLDVEDILIGEVWLCSGQSNMEWSVNRSIDFDLELLSANEPQIRIITVPRIGTQEPQIDFAGEWETVTPESVADFSAVGYYFAERLHDIIGVPIGLIDNAWGGSAAEAWVPREILEQYPVFESYIEEYDKRLRDYDAGRPLSGPSWWPRNPYGSQHRPGNLYNGVLYPVIGYTLRGTLWYQGESNSGRAEAYQTLFPLLINTWREAWEDDFYFYWVQLADFMAEATGPVEQDNWAELREAQTLTLHAVDKSGQAVIIDTGEGNDIHPIAKQTVANRLLRLALADIYGFDITSRSPMLRSVEEREGYLLVHFDHVGQQLRTFDTDTIHGFDIAGENGSFLSAEASFIDEDTIRVEHRAMDNPKHVRYGWATNPVVNVFSSYMLPLTPFRASVD